MKKQLCVASLILIMAFNAQASTIQENTGTGTSTTLTLDRPWYTSITVMLDENLPNSLSFIKDIWSSIVDYLFIDNSEESNPQVIGG